MISDDVVSTLGVIQFMLAVIVPILIYYANLRLLGGRIQFRVLSFLCVALTGLLMTLYSINNVLPLHEAILDAHGTVEDTDPYVLGAMMSGLVFGVLGTIPTAIFHGVRKRCLRMAAGSESHEKAIGN